MCVWGEEDDREKNFLLLGGKKVHYVSKYIYMLLGPQVPN